MEPRSVRVTARILQGRTGGPGMNAIEKLKVLAPAMAFEPAEETSVRRQMSAPCASRIKLSDSIHRAVMPGGKRIALLKTLLTSVCENNCNYCAFRQERDIRRVTFTPDELARAFIQLQKAGIAEGIFLSSGIAGGGVRIQDRLVATAEILRRRYEFGGYIHLKIMPGAEKDQIEAAMRLADRVSVNLEAPSSDLLAQLAPQKTFKDGLLQELKWIEGIRRDTPGKWPSSTTQFVVGAGTESDLDLLVMTEYLQRETHLARAYFSSFSPVPETPLEFHSPSPPLREHRLYQSSFLIRDYGFTVEELPFNDKGHLPLNRDPKLAWAEEHLTHSPVELNRVGRHELLRVPGIGPVGARRILHERRRGLLRDLSDLHKLGISSPRAAPFILLDGHRPAQQLSFWPT